MSKQHYDRGYENLLYDPTQRNLAYALLDQKVAGVFHDKEYAYVPVITQNPDAEKLWGIGVAVEYERGYTPITGPDTEFNEYREAKELCDGMNYHIGLHAKRAAEIVATSFRRN